MLVLFRERDEEQKGVWRLIELGVMGSAVACGTSQDRRDACLSTRRRSSWRGIGG